MPARHEASRREVVQTAGRCAVYADIGIMLLPIHFLHNLGQRGAVLPLQQGNHLGRLGAFAGTGGFLRLGGLLGGGGLLGRGCRRGLGFGAFGAFLGVGRGLLLAGALLRGGFLRSALRALFRNGGGLGFGAGVCVRHGGACPFGGGSAHDDSSLGWAGKASGKRKKRWDLCGGEAVAILALRGVAEIRPPIRYRRLIQN